jgi:hypothetical protein
MDRIKEERKKKAREYYLKNKDNPESSIYKRRQAKKDAVKSSKGKYGHRRLDELKAFIKRYNKHFQIKVTGKNRKQLEDAIDEGMKKKVDGDLKQAHERLLAPKQKVLSASEYLKQRKEEIKKEAQKKEEPKKTKKVIKIKIEKPKRTSFKRPSQRVEIGEINKGKIVKADTSKSQPVPSGKSPSKPSALPPRKNRKPAKSQPVPSGKSPSKPIGETKKERRRRLNEKIEQLKRGESIVGKN